MTREGKRVTPEEALEAMRDGCRVANGVRVYYVHQQWVYESSESGRSVDIEAWLSDRLADRGNLYIVYDPRHEEPA